MVSPLAILSSLFTFPYEQAHAIHHASLITALSPSEDATGAVRILNRARHTHG